MTEQLSVADVLERAADLIEPKGRWTQDVFSRNAHGFADATEDEISATDPVCWCVLGAVAQVSGENPAKDAFLLSSSGRSNEARNILNALVDRSIEDWNDDPDRTQAEVVGKLREAATAAREAEARS